MKVMVFDVGGTGIKYSVMDEQLNRTDTGSTPTPADSQEHFLNTLREIYLPHKDEVDGIALSLPGFIDAEQGVVKGGGALSLVYNVGTPLERGALKGCRNAAVFIIGTGVGAGLIIDGKLVRGRDCTAGEYSFMNTNADAWSDPSKTMAGQCSTSGLLSGYRARKGLPADAPMDGRIFFEAVHAGEAEANEALRSFCRAVPFGAAAHTLPRPEIVPCRFLSEANQIGAFASYQKAFWEN